MAFPPTVKAITNVKTIHLLGFDSAGIFLLCAQGYYPPLWCFCPKCEALGHTELPCDNDRGSCLILLFRRHKTQVGVPWSVH